MNRVLKIDDTFSITDARKIVNLRNYIIHASDNVVAEILWGIIVKHLPTLEVEIKFLLAD